MRRWTSEEIETLKRDYPTVPTKELAQVLGRSIKSVHMKAKRLRLHKIGRPGWRANPCYKYERRKHPLLPLTPKTAYAVGFILADGSINDWRVKLANTNPIILAKVRNALGFSHTLRLERKGPHDYFQVTITNKALASELRTIGILPNKSLTARLPNVPDELFNHFLRGYFDGDGTAKYTPRHGLTVRFVSGSCMLLEELAERLHRLLGVRLAPVCHDRGRPTANRLCYNCRDAERLGDYMYRDAGDLFIPKKRLPFMQYATRRRRNKLTIHDVEEIRHLAANGESAASIAKRFSVSNSLIRLILAGKRWVNK